MATVTVTATATDSARRNSSAVFNGYAGSGTLEKEITEKKSMRKEVIKNGVIYYDYDGSGIPDEEP